MDFLNSWYVMFPLVLCGFALVVLLVQFLWNTTIADMFSTKKITLVQSLKILILSFILSGHGSSLVSYAVATTDKNSKPAECKEGCTVTQDQSVTKTVKFGFP